MIKRASFSPKRMGELGLTVFLLSPRDGITPPVVVMKSKERIKKPKK